MKTIAFDFPLALYMGVPLAVAALALLAWMQVRRGQPGARVAASLLLRSVALLGVTALAAQPVWVDTTTSRRAPEKRNTVLLLVDGSANMSLEDGSVIRAAHTDEFAHRALLSALKRAGLQTRTFVFAEDATEIDSSRRPAPNKHVSFCPCE